MPMPLIEFIGLTLWEFTFAIIFYNSGSVLIRLVSLGKVNFPLIYPARFKTGKSKIKNAFLCYLVGIIFYMSLIVIWLLIKPNK
jgi:hypothetical protein